MLEGRQIFLDARVQRLVHGMFFGGTVNAATALIEGEIDFVAVIVRQTALLVVERHHMAVGQREGAGFGQGIRKHQPEYAVRLDVRIVHEGAGRPGGERQGGVAGRDAMPGDLERRDKGRRRGWWRGGRGQHRSDCTIAP